MKGKIHKYVLGYEAKRLYLHRDSTVLSAGFQPACGLVVWVAEVVPFIKSDLVIFDFCTRFTGEEAPDGYDFVQTVQTPDGLVWHIFVQVHLG